MIPDSRQSQASMLLQAVMDRLRDPRISSLLQYAAMGAIALDVILLIFRLALGQPLFGFLGLIVATAAGGISGAAVRYYLAGKQEETAYSPIPQNAPEAEPAPLDFSSAESPSVNTEDEAHSGEHAYSVTSGTGKIEAQAPFEQLEPEPSDLPKQMEMWPSQEVAETARPMPAEIPQQQLPEPLPVSEPEQPQGTGSMENHFLTWIMGSAQIFFVVINERDEIVMANHYTYESLGYTETEIIGQCFTWNLVPPRLRREAWTDLLKPGRENEKGMQLQSCVLSKAGHEVPVQWHGMAIFDAEGSLSHCLLMGFDLTEQKKLEDEFEKSRLQYKKLCSDATTRGDRFRSVLDSSVDPILLLDLQGKATYVNTSFTALFGWTVGDLQSSEKDFVPEAQGKLEKPFLDSVLDQGIPCNNLNTRRQAKDGSSVSVRMTAARVCDDAGQCTGMLITLRKLVERVKDGKEQLKPPSTPHKRQVNAKEIAKDIRSGATDLFLMEKYKLTAKGLNSLFQKLVEAKVVKASEIVRRSAVYDETVAIEVSRIVPMEKPKPVPATKKPAKVSPSPARPARTDVQGLDKFGLTEDNLEDLVKGLLPQDVKIATSKEEDASDVTQESEDVTVLRTMPRHYMVVSVPIYESNNLLRQGTIIDISEQGLKIQGIDTVKGETKSLLIQGDEFHDVFPFIFDGVCRWSTTDETTGECIAGFQITVISETSIQELRKLISALSIGA